MLSLKSVII